MTEYLSTTSFRPLKLTLDPRDPVERFRRIEFSANELAHRHIPGYVDKFQAVNRFFGLPSLGFREGAD